MKHIILLVLLLFTFSSKGQSYSIEEIRKQGNEYLKSLFSDTSILAYCLPFDNILIGYKINRRDTLFEWVNDNNLPKGKFISAKLAWTLKIPYPECPIFDTITEIISIVLDKSLLLEEKPDLSFIPKSYYLKDSCKFISKSKVKEITEGQNFKFGTDSLQMILDFDHKRKIYTWEISKIYCKEIDDKGNCWGDIEVMILDAESGDIITHGITSYVYIVDF